jgi:hypothetical protein
MGVGLERVSGVGIRCQVSGDEGDKGDKGDKGDV